MSSTPSDLFVYGTLLFPEVLRAVTGRARRSRPATLDRFVRRGVSREVFPAIVEGSEGDAVAGTLYLGLDDEDWRRLDRFEGELYERRAVTVRLSDLAAAGSAVREGVAFTYVLAARSRHRLSRQPWEPETFARHHLQTYLARIATVSEPRARG